MNFIAETERLRFRPFQLGVEDGVYEFASNPEVQKLTGDKNAVFKNDTRKLITDIWLKDYESYGYGRFAIIHKEDNKIIGFNGIKFLKDINNSDLGYRVLPKYVGKGIATESSKPILKFAFENIGLEELLGFIMFENNTSAKVLEKLKFQQTEIKPFPGETEKLLCTT
ncbi:GNAT family N-acetyltransferase [Patiriisocius sp. Uisw_017]|uniref:GNAT family N-acetyltransferase n=1 Tax=Patiriisocius sp. Uisw_017 TaxID=3230968 RepID=UPI0039EC81C3